MSEELVIHIGRRALETAFLIGAPSLAVATVVGLLVAMIQAVTSIKDQTAGMVLKLAAIGITLLLFGTWMLQLSMQFTVEVFSYMRQGN